MNQYPNLMKVIYGTPWAIRPEMLSVIADIVEMRARGETLTADEIEARTNGRQSRTPSVSGSVSVLPLFGVINHRMSAMGDISGATSTEGFGKRFDAAVADPSVGAIVIDTDSPGGSVAGVQELSQKIFDARKSKRIVAVANAQMASAAFWIASAADQVVVTPSGEVGSVGVVAIHQDVSQALEDQGVKTTIIRSGKFKAEGNEFEPMSEDAAAFHQAEVDAVHETFISDLSRNRDVSKARVRSDFGQGRMMRAGPALEHGLVDRIATLERVVADLNGETKRRRASQRAIVAAMRAM